MFRATKTIGLSLSVLTIVLAGCASGGRHETRVEREAVMTVEAIDVPHRLVTVRNAQGESITVYVDESVKTFPQAGVGDQVRVRYVESMAFQLKKSGEASKAFEVTEETARPKPGQPAGAASTEVKATVRIELVQDGGRTVVFTGPRGRRMVTIGDADLREYARNLKPGDTVEVTYKEAVALSLEKLKP